MDQEFYRKELASFLPERMFDMHAHLWSERFCELRNPTGFASDVTYDEYTRLMQQAFPDHVFGGWFLPKPLLKDREKDALAASEWVAEQVAGRTDAYGAFLLRPEDDPEWVREQAQRLGLRGLKCYQTLAKSRPTYEADIPDYLPESCVRVAHEEVRSRPRDVWFRFRRGKPHQG